MQPEGRVLLAIALCVQGKSALLNAHQSEHVL